jgi:hypothetical protein
LSSGLEGVYLTTVGHPQAPMIPQIKIRPITGTTPALTFFLPRF